MMHQNTDGLVPNNSSALAWVCSSTHVCQTKLTAATQLDKLAGTQRPMSAKLLCFTARYGKCDPYWSGQMRGPCGCQRAPFPFPWQGHPGPLSHPHPHHLSSSCCFPWHPAFKRMSGRIFWLLAETHVVRSLSGFSRRQCKTAD